jgi:flagellar biosynthetic protein FliP
MITAFRSSAVSSLLRHIPVLVVALFMLASVAPCAFAQNAGAAASPALSSGISSPTGPLGVQIRFDGGETPETLSTGIRILILMTVLSLAPSAMIMLTGFTRILIVLSIVRRAIGLQSAPPNQLIAGLAMFLTFFVMRPVFEEIHTNAWVPLRAGQINDAEAWDRAAAPLRTFMLRQSGESELRLFHELANEPIPATPDEVKLGVLVPSFMVSELKTAFQMGFLVWLPFLVIDLVLASSLMALGMMMLPPMMISLPIKVLFFVLADGWTIVIHGLVKSFF